jgi:C-terminal processing protease CtpA/Prc
MRRWLARTLLTGLCLLGLAASGGAADGARFGGIGAQVVPTTTGELVVLGVLAESPAARSGLRPGDLIVEVDDFALWGSDFRRVVKEHLWGAVGSTVRLRYLRPGQLGRHQVKVERIELQPEQESLPGVQLLHPGEQERGQ